MLINSLTGATTIAGAPSIHPLGVRVGSVQHDLKNHAKEPFLHRQTDLPLMTSPVGYTIPNPVTISGTPRNNGMFFAPPATRPSAMLPPAGGCK